MKHISNILKTAGLMACMGLFTTSCDLDVLPLNEVVLENYWTDKTDVENTLRSCYTAMQSSSWMTQVITWGEVRSDNISSGPDVPTALQNLIKGNLKQTNSACDWAPLYTVINRCNIVLKYAPEVAEKDPNFTESDLKSTIAEAKAIRALNYFYLIRTFKDVPFSFEPSIDDSQDYVVPATAHETILDSLIQDLEGCKDDAPRRYTTETTSTTYAKNTGRITRAAIYALLADLYLWRGSDANLDAATQRYYYEKCIESADFVINQKMDEYDDDPDNTLKTKMDTWVYSNFGYPLIAERSSSSTGSSYPKATYDIFYEGNSWESLFEITYTKSASSSETKNTGVSYMYGGNNADGGAVQYCVASTNLLETALSGSDKTYNDNDLFPVCSDYRSIYAFRYTDSGSYDILKYVNNLSGLGMNEQATTTAWTAITANGVSTRPYNSSYENWIVYRLTDVMLMRAEAEIQIAGMLSADAETDTTAVDTTATDSTGVKRRANAVNGSSLSTAQELYDDAYNLILAVYMRSNPYAQSVSASAAQSFRPNRSDYTTYDQFEELIENERHREFIFEGKRYYDLVRRARREGNTSHFAATIATKFGEASKSVLIKMAMMDFMYMPYAEGQLDVNPYLKQNPAYAEDEETVKN